MAVKKVFLHFLILVLHFPPYESADTITTHKRFKDGDVITSKNRKFSFGFFSTPGNSRYRYLGIRFHNISEASVVWVANRNHPISGSTGFLSINQYGNLVLYNDPIQKIPLWSTNVSSEATGPSVAQLLETGNLVLLQGRKRKILWQSFDHPTDTHLPGIKLGEDKVTLAENARKSNLSVRKDLRILIFSVTSVWVTVMFFTYLWIMRKKRVLKNRLQKKLFDPTFGSVYYKNTLVASELRQSSKSPDIPFFDLSSVVEATNNFSATNKLGEGGFGVVYKGHLFDGQEVAIKRLSKNSDQGVEEFKNEVMLIAKLQHRNLVKLLGCCIDEEERLLIYEYMPNKALDSILFDQTRRSLLDWRKRFEIIIEIARGLVYLHQDSRLNVIHRDLKCSNILLDANMKPKISDFGMARIFRVDQIQEKTNRVVGTYGYMSPEYALLGKFSVKSDAFSFGVMLLEIVSAKKNNSFQEEDTSQTLIGHVWDLWKQGRVLEIIDPTIKGSCEPHQVLRCINIGLLCVQEHARDRPTMSQVVWMLSSESAVTSPKKPAFTYTNTAQEATGGSKSTNEVSVSIILPR